MQKFLEHFNTRQQMQKTSFEIFHYFDSKPGSVALHHHDFYEIYFFISGQVEYQIEGRSYQLQPGDLLLISPLELHQPIFESVVQPYERIVLWISPAFLSGTQPKPPTCCAALTSAITAALICCGFLKNSRNNYRISSTICWKKVGHQPLARNCSVCLCFYSLSSSSTG